MSKGVELLTEEDAICRAVFLIFGNNFGPGFLPGVGGDNRGTMTGIDKEPDDSIHLLV